MLRIIGKSLMAAGALMLLFVAYELFGTNLVAKQNQKALAAELQAALDDPILDDPTLDDPTLDDPTLDDPTLALPAAPPPKPDLGEGIARIQIPKISVDWIVVEGVSVEALKKGPGHYPGTALFGERGNAVISGHRTTYGAPFFRLDELRPGDILTLITPRGTYEYRVTESKIVAPTEVSVLDPSRDARLTLTTCNPKFSAKQRLIVIAKLVEDEPGQQAA